MVWLLGMAAHGRATHTGSATITRKGCWDRPPWCVRAQCQAACCSSVDLRLDVSGGKTNDSDPNNNVYIQEPYPWPPQNVSREGHVAPGCSVMHTSDGATKP